MHKTSGTTQCITYSRDEPYMVAAPYSSFAVRESTHLFGCCNHCDPSVSGTTIFESVFHGWVTIVTMNIDIHRSGLEI